MENTNDNTEALEALGFKSPTNEEIKLLSDTLDNHRKAKLKNHGVIGTVIDSNECYDCGSKNIEPTEYKCKDCGHNGYCL